MYSGTSYDVYTLLGMLTILYRFGLNWIKSVVQSPLKWIGILQLRKLLKKEFQKQ